MDPVVATYMISVRQWAAASEKLNCIAHHIPFNIQGLHPLIATSILQRESLDPTGAGPQYLPIPVILFCLTNISLK